jgi:hypothetical protein
MLKQSKIIIFLLKNNDLLKKLYIYKMDKILMQTYYFELFFENVQI